MFLSEYSVPSTPSRKRKFSNTFSRVEIFENGDLSYSCGRAFKYDDVMPRFEARSSARMVRKCFVWTLIFFKHRGKSYVFENTWMRVDSQIRFESATCGRIRVELSVTCISKTRDSTSSQRIWIPTY